MGGRPWPHIYFYFYTQTCFQPPEPDLELESGLFYSGTHFLPWWYDGGGVCTHRLLCPLPPHRPPPVSSCSLSIHITSRTVTGSGRRRPQAWKGGCGLHQNVVSHYLPKGPPITQACVRREGQPFPQSTLDTETRDEMWHM